MEWKEKGGIYTYGDVTMGQGYCHDKAHITLSKHFEMRRVATKYMSDCQSRKYKTGIQRRHHPILLASYSSESCLNHLFDYKWNLSSTVSQLNFEKYLY